MKEIHKKLEKLKIGSGTKSFRNGLSKGNMIFSEESSRTFYDLGNMEWIELRQTSVTTQCLSCLKHVPEGLNMCQCVVWLRPNQSTLDRITTAFAAFFTLYYRASIVISRGMKSGHKPMATTQSQSHGCKKRSDEVYRESRIGTRMDWRVGQVPRLHLRDWHQS